MPNLLQNIPQGWEILPFSKCVNKISIKHKVKTKDYLKNGKYPIIDQAKDFIGGYSNDKNLLINIKKPVVVFGDHTRCFKFVDFDFIAGADGIKILSPIDKFNEKLFYYFCLSLQFEDKGYSRHYQFLEKTNIKIPPLETQKAIVEKLENAFAHIDEAVRHLKAVQTNIPRLKSSLLHSAFSGKLTESQNQSNEVQTLKSVVEVEGEFEREEGATSPFKPLHPLIKEEIPQGWELKTLGEVAKIKGGKRIPKGSKYADIPTQYPYIRVTDFEDMSVNTKNLKYLTDEIQEKIKNYTISKDDVYISIAGSIGKVGIIPDELDKANLTENAAKIIHSMNKKYLAFYLNSNEIQSQISFLTKATTQPKLALNRIENLIIKIPPLETQKQIVQILESKFAHLEKLAQFVNASLENLQRLKSSLLNQAFKGELVC